MCTSVPNIEDTEFKFIEKLRDCYLIQLNPLEVEGQQSHHFLT